MFNSIFLTFWHVKKVHVMGEIMVKRTKNPKVKIVLQGLHMTRVFFALVYNFVFQIPHLILHFKYKYILITN